MKNQLQSLQGLDGEATERIVEHLAEPAAEQQEPEEEYAVARVLANQSPSGLALPSNMAAYVMSKIPKAVCTELASSIQAKTQHMLCY